MWQPELAASAQKWANFLADAAPDHPLKDSLKIGQFLLDRKLPSQKVTQLNRGTLI